MDNSEEMIQTVIRSQMVAHHILKKADNDLAREMEKLTQGRPFDQLIATYAIMMASLLISGTQAVPKEMPYVMSATVVLACQIIQEGIDSGDLPDPAKGMGH